MDHFDNCAAFEPGFGRALKAHEARCGHLSRLPMSMLTGKADGAPPVEGQALMILREIARQGNEITIRYGMRSEIAEGTDYVNTKMSTLVTRGFLAVSVRHSRGRTLRLTEAGAAALAAVGAI